MRVVVGLGNPGAKFEGTRHNLGAEVVKRVGRRLRAPLVEGRGPALQARTRRRGEDVLLLCPLTFMNLSGTALRRLDPGRTWDPARVLVVYDDVDLPVGKLRMRSSGSDGGHRGARSVIEALGTEGFPRLRVGVGRAGNARDTADHVLQRPGEEDSGRLEKAVAEAAQAVLTWLDSASTQIAMNRVNRPAPPEDPGE